MQILVKVSLALGLLVTAAGSNAAQSSPVTTSAESEAVHGGAQSESTKPPACRDTTPHTKILVTVDKGVQLEVLDWGGPDKSATMVLLTGLGDSAHVYDQFAFQFTDYFRVIGITRRGFLPSSQPPEGYDVETRAHDDIEVLKALGIRSAVFVGHSVAGSELSKIGATYSKYVRKLVYLDAHDLSERFQLSPIPGAPYVESDGRSLEIFQAAQARLENTLRPSPSVCIALQFDSKGAITGATTPDGISEKILAGVRASANPPTDWSLIAVPRLGIFDQPSVEARLPYYPYLSPADKKEFDNNWPGLVDWYTETIDKFAAPHVGSPHPIVDRLPDAPHYFYINDQAFVIQAMREFLLGKVGK